MATNSITSLSIQGGSHLKSRELWSSAHISLGNAPRLTYQRKSNQWQPKKLSVRAEYNDRKGGEGEFVAGFLLGGALFASAAYMLSPKIRQKLHPVNEHGFMIPKGPMYEAYLDEGLEKTENSLNAKINQLTFAIDKVYRRLRGGKKKPRTPVKPRIPVTPPIPIESDEDEFIEPPTPIESDEDEFIE